MEENEMNDGRTENEWEEGRGENENASTPLRHPFDELRAAAQGSALSASGRSAYAKASADKGENEKSENESENEGESSYAKASADGPAYAKASAGEGVSKYLMGNLGALLETQKQIRVKKSKPIEFSNAILWRNEDPVIFPKTINVIQGKAGTHKSRLAETICAVLLRKETADTDLLNFKTLGNEAYAVCYVDTERNLSDQLPYSLQQIQLKAGFDMAEHPFGFDYISLLAYPREERFEMLNEYLAHIRSQFKIHLFIVLDVITDCVFNFNDTKDSMRLIDMLNQSINKYDVTFLCLIHENPGSGDKARGHLGTEIRNKASTVLQIGFEKIQNVQSNDLLKVAYLKCRNSKMHDPFYVHFSAEKKGLALVAADVMREHTRYRIVKAEHEEVLELLPQYINGPMKRKHLLSLLCFELKCNERTMEKRIRDIVIQKMEVSIGDKYFLLCKSCKDREIYYSLNAL